MLALALICFIVGLFVARNILWPVAGVLLVIALVFFLVSPSYGYY